MNLLFLTFVFPLLGYLILAFSRGRMSENLTASVGVGAVALSALTSAWIALQFVITPPEDGVYTQHLWQWLDVAGFKASVGLYLDGLSLTMLCVVTGVGFLIHLFASWYMRGEEGYSRFFA
ncbi:MAG TPA: NADH-quinone oxidoreductase subunit L, partial [Pseudomonas sp.]|nr:NADH-quinone oxidoreductase subunit L [Pseudomonas sp.]